MYSKFFGHIQFHVHFEHFFDYLKCLRIYTNAFKRGKVELTIKRLRDYQVQTLKS